MNELAALLSNEIPGATERLVAASSRQRFDDLAILVRLVSCCDALATWVPALRGLHDDIAGGDAATDPRLRSPVFKAWLNRFGRVDDWHRPGPLAGKLLRLVPNMRHRLLDDVAWESALRVENGSVATWDGGCVLSGVRGESVDVCSRPGRVEIATGDGRVEVPHLSLACWPHAPFADGPLARVCVPLPGSAIHVRNDVPALQVKLDCAHLFDRHKVLDRDALDHRPETYGAFDGDEFLEAAAWVRDLWPEEYRDWVTTMRMVVPLRAPSGVVVHGLTDAARQGACWIGSRGLLPIIDALVHEQSHVKLRYIEESIPILDAVQSVRSFKVGWRDDPRPVEGILEGVYVHLHVIEMLGRLCEGASVPGTLRDGAMARARALSAQVAEALPLLEQNAWFTPAGRAFPAWARDRLAAACRAHC